MRKQSRITPTIFTMLLVTCLHGQKLELTDKYLSVGEDARFAATGFSPGNFIRISADIPPFQFSIPTNSLTPSGGKYSGTIITNRYALPGLYSHSARHIAKKEGTALRDTLPLIDTSFFYIPSPGRSQQIFPSRDNAQLPFTANNQTRLMRDNLQHLRDSFRLAFNRMNNTIPYKTGENGEVIKYNIDSLFYDRIDSVVNTWAGNLDSGKVVEAAFIINFSHGLTIFNWKQSGNRQDSLPNSARTYFDSLMNFVQVIWHKDALIKDTAAVGARLWDWAREEHGSNSADDGAFFRRTDNYIVPILLDRYSTALSKKKRYAWLGFSHDKHLEQFLILFSFTGKKPRKTP